MPSTCRGMLALESLKGRATFMMSRRGVLESSKFEVGMVFWDIRKAFFKRESDRELCVTVKRRNTHTCNLLWCDARWHVETTRCYQLVAR